VRRPRRGPDCCRLPFPTDLLQVTVFYDEPRVVIVSLEHRLAGKERLTLDDIADGPLPRLRESDPAWSASGQAIVIAAGQNLRAMRSDLTVIPLADVDPAHVMLATRADDRSRLVAAFRKYAQAQLTRPHPAAPPRWVCSRCRSRWPISRR
jgi:hypothetical protein